jgi:hypothetical protein
LIIKACDSLDETLSDLFFREWQLALLDKLEPSPEEIQQDGSELHGMNTFATSDSPGQSDLSSTSDGYDSEDPGEPSGAEGPSDACNSEDGDISSSDEPAVKKPRLESDILDQSLPETSLMPGLPTGAIREVIDLTGDSSEREQKSFDIDVPIPSLETKRAIWTRLQAGKKLEKKAAKTHAAQIKSSDSPEPKLETKRARWWKQRQADKKARKIHAAQIKFCDDEKKGELLTAEDIELEKLRMASSATFSVPPMPPSFPMSPRPLATEPPESPAVHPRSISPMSEEGMAMYQ